MALSCDWNTKIITVPQSDLSLDSGTKYNLDVTYWFQLLRELMGSIEGVAETVNFPLYSNTPPTSSTPRIVDVTSGYTVQFENLPYSVELINGNTNIRDVEIKNQVSVGTNNTTGFIDPTFLEAGLFDAAVAVDVVNGVAGTYKTPSGAIIGTRQTPSNNIADAIAIAIFRGIKQLNIIHSLTLVDEDLSAGYALVGDSPFVVLTVNALANVTSCSMSILNVVGEMDGLNMLQDCSIGNVTNVSGFIDKCAFNGTITLSGETFITQSYSEAEGLGYVDIDTNGHVLMVRDCHGSFGVSGMTAGISSIQINGGRLILDNTCIGGSVYGRGEPFDIIDGSAGTLFIDQTSSKKVNELLTFKQFIGLK